MIPDLTGFADEGPPYSDRLIRMASAQLPASRARRTVLVVHSGAGVFAPYLAERSREPVLDVVFADATVPPESGENRIVGSAALEFLSGLARDGIVPPWPQWWSDDVLADLFPDPQTQRAVSAEATGLPLDFYRETPPPVPPSWYGRRRAFLCFSESYLSQAEEARRQGWPVRHVPGEHLHMLVDPPGVAAAIAEFGADLAANPHGG